MQFKILMLTFKAIHGIAPDYINCLVAVKQPSCYALRRNNELLLQPFNVKTYRMLGDRAVSAASPSPFNALPHYIGEEHNYDSFKALVKTHLFGIAYEH